MYEAFYGLTEKPFNLTPDPRFLYLSEKHKEAFAHLVYGISNRSGFIMVSGEIGTGKTTICRSLLNQLEDDVEVAFIFNPCLSPEELLQTINEDFGIDSKATTIKGLIDELNAYLLDRFANGKNCILLIDESQNLTPGVLEQIRLLSNLETETQKLLQIILIGQPELAQHLQLPELRQLNQRVTARYHLKQLDLEETIQYVAHRLRVAGGRRKISFTRGAMKTLYRISEGTPRVINAVCDRALLVGYTKETRTITKSIMKRAHRELAGEVFRPKRSFGAVLKRFLPSPAVVPTVAVIFLAFLLAAYMVPYMVPQNVAAPMPSASDNRAPDAARPTVTNAGSNLAEASPQPPASVVKQPPVVVAKVAPVDKAAGLAKAGAPVPFADRIIGADPSDSLKAAIMGVFRTWDLALVTVLPKVSTAGEIGNFVRASGMSVEILKPALDQLIALNLPAIVQVRSKGKDLWVGVTGFADGRLQIAMGAEGNVNIPRDEFRDVYEGHAVVPWLDPAPGTRAIGAAAGGAEVAELQKKLQQLNRLAGGVTGRFNEETSRAIARIQAETGLAVDGVAGKQVRMVMASWLMDSGMPSLSPNAIALNPSVEQKAITAGAASVLEAPASVPTADVVGMNPLPGLVFDVQKESLLANGFVGGSVGVESLPPVRKNDSLGPIDSDSLKEVTPPLTGNALLVPRQPEGDQG